MDPQGGSKGWRGRSVRSDSTVVATSAARRVFSTSGQQVRCLSMAKVSALTNRMPTFDGLSSAAVPVLRSDRTDLETELERPGPGPDVELELELTSPGSKPDRS